MRAVDAIHAKREGRALAPDVISDLVHRYVVGEIPDYQVAALLMAIYFKGLDATELAALTTAMMRSGEVYDLSDIPGVKADKHSTGGVGDKVSLVLAPLAAACGLVVPMVSGRGLGHTGGTLDKLEAIPGFRVGLAADAFRRQLRAVGVAMIGQTERFVPADKKLYALRDVTATVESIPLITASIMSKKLAEGCDVLVLDLKVGSGAFMTTLPRARELARSMIGAGTAMGRKVRALVTDMDQPLGRMVGNANEVRESIDCLAGRGPADLREVTLALTGAMLVMGEVAADDRAARAMLEGALASGAALERFRRMVEAQGGDPRVVDDPGRLPSAPHETVVTAPRAGVLARVQCREVGLAAVELGAGRATADEAVDPGVGLEVCARRGDRVVAGQPLVRVAWRDGTRRDRALARLAGAFEIADAAPELPPLVHETLE